MSAPRFLPALLISIALAASITQTSVAASMPSNEDLRAAIIALEARVAALEAQLEQKASTQQEASKPRPTFVALAEPMPNYTPMRLGNQTPPPQAPHNGWSGLYWGTSFGYGSALSSSRYRTKTNREEQFKSDEVSTDVEDDGSTETEFSFDNDVFGYNSVAIGSSNGPERKDGALIDLYLGANALLMPRVVAGFQVEGSLAEMTFGSRIRKENVNFQETSSNEDSDVSTNGDTSSSTGSSKSAGNETSVFDRHNEADLDWMVSVLGRAGILATPTTLLYGVGGWSYGHFQVSELTFGNGKIRDFFADGPTVGGGFEQKLSSKWSLRAEYRYTNFGTKNFSTRSRFAQSQSDSGSSRDSNENTFEGETQIDSSSSTENDSYSFTETEHSKGNIDNDLHVGRIGVTRYFSIGD